MSDPTQAAMRNALWSLMTAYQRLVRSNCKTPEDLSAEPWRCWEYVQAEKAVGGLACGSAGPTGGHCTLPADHSDDQCSGVAPAGTPSRWSRQLSRIATGADKKDRAERMPDERAALLAMFDAFQRLRDLGWREAQYCPKDGTEFKIIETGSTGIFEAYYQGEWPDGYIISHDGSDSYVSRPGHVIMFRERKDQP